MTFSKSKIFIRLITLIQYLRFEERFYTFSTVNLQESIRLNSLSLFSTKNMNLFSEQNNKNIHLQNSENILRESASRNSMSMLKSLVDQSAEAIAVLDHNLCYLTVSSKWLKNYNLKLAEVINHNYSEVLTANLYQDHGIYDNSFEQGKYHQTEQVLIDHNGIVKRFQLNIYPWKNSQDQIIGLIVILSLIHI